MNARADTAAAPRSTSPALNARYWVPSLVELTYAESFGWLGDPMDEEWLARGLVFDSQEAAADRARAMLSAFPVPSADSPSWWARG